MTELVLTSFTGTPLEAVESVARAYGTTVSHKVSSDGFPVVDLGDGYWADVEASDIDGTIMFDVAPPRDGKPGLEKAAQRLVDTLNTKFGWNAELA